MDDRIRYKGRFVKQKVLDKKLKIAKALREKKESNNLTANNNVKSNQCEGNRIVDLKILGKYLKCCRCKEVLSLDNVVGERHLGLNSILNVKCTKCFAITKVPTGKVHVPQNNKSKHSDINTSAVLGAIHAGFGCTGLNKLLVSLNIPTISAQLFKRYEREVGPAIEEAAQKSCVKVAEEEQQLCE